MSRRLDLAAGFAALAAVVISLQSESARAEEATPAAVNTKAQLSTDGWRFEVEPYVWFSAVSVEAERGPIEAEVDAEFKDLFELMNGGLMIHAEAQRDPWGVFTDIAWCRLKKDGDRGGIDMEANIDQLFLEVGGYYRFTKPTAKRVYTFDTLVGARYMLIKSDVEITGSAGGNLDLNDSKDVIDPIIGERFRVQLNEKWSSGIRVDIGGFGVGTDFTWNLNTETRYRFNDLFSLAFGYRYMSIDVEEDGTDLQTTFNGPGVGFLFTF